MNKKFNFSLILWFVIISIGAILPFLASSSVVRIAIVSMIFSLPVLSFSFLASQLGLVSLMQGTLFGIAAYIVAILEVKFGILFPLSALAAILGVAVISGVLALGFLRTRGVYFLLLTLVIGLAFWTLSIQWVEVSGGTTGIIGVRPPSLLGISLVNQRTFYYAVLTVTLVCFFSFLIVRKSSFGLLLRGIKNNERRMRVLGYRVGLLIWLGFVVASLPAAMGGILQVYDLNVMNPHQMTLATNVYVVLAGILGGVETTAGPFVGALLVKLIDYELARITQRYLLVSGIIFIIIIAFRAKAEKLVKKFKLTNI